VERHARRETRVRTRARTSSHRFLKTIAS
jgi:hypothetical protein